MAMPTRGELLHRSAIGGFRRRALTPVANAEAGPNNYRRAPRRAVAYFDGECLPGRAPTLHAKV